MIIPRQTLLKWKKVREQGDLSKMVKHSAINGEKVTRHRLSRALDLGRCSEETYQILKKYYTRKLKLIEA